MKKILLICVDYNSHAETIKFVNHINQFRTSTIKIDIVVVCNSGSSNFSSIETMASIYDFGDNLGYMGGAHAGYEKYKDKNGVNPDWVILTNTDISIQQSDFFIRLASATPDKIIAPDIIGGDGQAQNPFLRKPISNRKVDFLILINMHITLHYLYNLLSRIKNVTQTIIKSLKCRLVSPVISNFENIYAPHGAFIIFGSGFFDSGENLQHITFLYGEELCIAEKATRSNIPVVYDKSFKVYHEEHTTTGKLGSKRKSQLLLNALVAFKENFRQ